MGHDKTWSAPKRPVIFRLRDISLAFHLHSACPLTAKRRKGKENKRKPGKKEKRKRGKEEKRKRGNEEKRKRGKRKRGKEEKRKKERKTEGNCSSNSWMGYMETDTWIGVSPTDFQSFQRLEHNRASSSCAVKQQLLQRPWRRRTAGAHSKNN